MAGTGIDREAIAAELRNAAESRRPIAPIVSRYPTFSLEDAYAVQMRNIAAALEAGRRISGKKIGLTSKAMQDLMGVDQPDYGHLFADMEVTGGLIAADRVIQAKVEAEIAFVLARDLPDADVTAEEVLSATDYVVPALEIVDSRIENWKIGLPDTVADNASSGLYVLGSTRTAPRSVDLRKVSMELSRNGSAVNRGMGADVLGDPAYCVAWLANKLRSLGTRLMAGEVILSGALSAAVAAVPGDRFGAKFSSLGSVEVRFQ